MVNWISIKQLSKKRGIAESTLRGWAQLGFISYSTVENTMMLDEGTLIHYLNVHKSQILNEESINKLIEEKKVERETLLSRLDDDIFLLKTQSLYQPLLQILIDELGHLILNDLHRELFLAISGGEPISRVAERYGMTYNETKETYQSVLEELSKNKARIATYRQMAMKSLLDKYKANPPLRIPLRELLSDRICNSLMTTKKIITLDELLQYTAKNGWAKLKDLKNFGGYSYAEMIKSLFCAGFIVIDENKNIELSPELAAYVR